MKKYCILYKGYTSDKIKSLIVYAQCTSDANDYFFNNYSGMLLRTEFISWV